MNLGRAEAFLVRVADIWIVFDPVDRLQPVEMGLVFIRQRLIGQMHVRKPRIAARTR